MPASDQHTDQDTGHSWGEKAGTMGLAYRKEVEVLLSRIHAREQLT